MKIACIQMDIACQDPAENLRCASEWMAEAVTQGADLVVLPEMFSTGFTMDAEGAANSGPATLAAMMDLAKEHSAWLMGGIVEAGDGGASKPRNVCVVLNPAGVEAGRYRKIHPFTLAGEHKSYDGGTELLTIEMSDGLRVTPLVCYDLRFPELFRARADETDLFCVVASWPSKRIAAWRALLIARAIENQCYVLGVNRVGEMKGVEHCGASMIVGPDGSILSEAGSDPACLVLSVEPSVVAAHRKAFSFLADRRPDVYQKNS